MIEIIYTQEDGSFADKDGKLDTLYVDDNHFSLLKWAKTHKQDKMFTSSTHWRLYSISSNKKKHNPDFLALDIDQVVGKERIKFNVEHIRPVISYFKLKKENLCINFTGYGYHIYIFFDESFDLNTEKAWLKPCAKEIDSELKKTGLKIDPASFQANQTLRMPGSIYHKKDMPMGLTFVVTSPEEKASWKEFKKKFISESNKNIQRGEMMENKKVKKNFIRESNKKKKTSLNKELKKNTLKEIYKNKDINWTAIMSTSGCRFLVNQYHDQVNVDYHEWLAQLTLTSKYNKSEKESFEWAKQFSQKSEKYNEQEFHKKFLETRYNMQPVTCNYIEGIWKHGKTAGIGCIDCPSKKLNQPLNIVSYPDMNNGFRILNAKGVRGKINYESFCDWLIEQHLIQAEKDETLYKYNGKYWQVYGENELISSYKKYIKPFNEPNEIKKISLFLKNHRIFNIEKEREKTKDLIFFRNAILDVKKQKLSEKFNMNIKNFYRMEFDYDEKAESPTFNKILDFSFKNKTKDRDYFLMYMAAALFTEDNLHKALILLGDGANGKSTLIYTANCLFPSESSVFTKLDLAQFKKEPSMLSALRRSKIAYCSDESPNMFNKNINLLKQLISKEDFIYRQKYARNSTYFRNQSKLIIGMNSLPFISDSTFGMKRRFSFLDFENQLKEAEFDPDIFLKLRKERAGIFNVYYEALKKYKKLQNFPLIENNMLDTAVYLGDVKEAFWKDCVEVTGIEGKQVSSFSPANKEPLADRVSSTELWEEFQKYRTKENDNGSYAPSRRMFTQWVIKKKIKQNKKLSFENTSGRGVFYGFILKKQG